MNAIAKRSLGAGAALFAAFALWTALVQLVDVRPVGQKGADIGFAALNTWFHQLTGVHMQIYAITDWLGLVPIEVCLGFAALGAVQLVRRRSLLRVDPDLLLLGTYYVAVAFFYLLFEAVPVNYRPIPIDGAMGASYPSSTTLLVLSVMPALKHQVDRRSGSPSLKKATTAFAMAFSALMVAGRLVSGVHWVTGIIGSILLASALFMLYRGAVEASETWRASRGMTMEFNEKLQELRKAASLTQEELADAVFVSRIAVSKRESGRGYPSIDSLKELARFFHVSIDELIGPDEIVAAAEEDKRSYTRKNTALICGILDVLAALLLFIPVFGNGAEDPSAASLLALTSVSPWVKAVFAAGVSATVICGLCEVAAAHFDKMSWNKTLLTAGITLSVACIAIFIATRQPYAGIVCFALLAAKSLLLLRRAS